MGSDPATEADQAHAITGGIILAQHLHESRQELRAIREMFQQYLKALSKQK